MEGLKVVRQSQVKTIGKYPRGGVFSTQGEFLLLENEFRRIVVLRLDTWTEVFRIVLNQVAYDAIWYMPSKDGIILLQRDLETAELTFILFLNWRVADPRNPKCSVAPAAKKPNNWRFEPQEAGFHSFALGCFTPNSSVVAQVHDNAIVIVSESMALFWDISDRPVLRFILLLPPPLVRPIFAFLGDRLAIITQGTLLILQTVAGATVLTDPFTPGSKCFELHETLVPHFGVTQDNVNANSLFIVRHLPDRPVNIQILYEWRPPGDPRALSFIPPVNTLLILTSLGVFACRVGSGDPGFPNYLPDQLSSFQGATRIDFNRDFLILAVSSNLSIFPNPEKSGLQFGDSFEVLEKVTYKNILFIATNVEFCVVVTGSPNEQKGHQKADEEAAIYVLKFEDVNALARRLSSAADLSAKRAGLRLKTPSDRDFADQVYTIGLHLLKSPGELANAISYLTKAFNSGIPEAQRATILAEVLRQRPTAKRSFIREAVFRGDELDDALMRAILALPPAQAIRKLIQAKRFDQGGDFGDVPEAALFRAIAASRGGDHAAARPLFASVSPNLLKLLDDELLSAVSDDLSPQTLIAIGRPELANSQWTMEERQAAFHFAGGRLEAALEIAAENLRAEWHFSEWPVRPKLVDWVDGSAMLQFAAGCFTAYNVGRAVPDAFRHLADACSLAKEGRFGEALAQVRESVYPFDFLRCFAHGPAGWAAVIGQVEDPDLRRCAIHFLIASSPKKVYKAVLPRLSIPGLSEIADELRATDDELLALTAAAVGIK
jgi:hypothetical protein